MEQNNVYALLHHIAALIFLAVGVTNPIMFGSDWLWLALE
jgi:hypothetical protein